MACRAALRTASAVSSRSHATVHQDSAEKASMARVNVRAYAHDGTAMWKWIGVAVVAAVLAAVYGYEP
jgi:hypothetical protein